MVDVGGSRPRGCCSMAVAPDPRLRCLREWKHRHIPRCTTSSTQAGRWDRKVRGTGRPMTSWRQFEANRRNALKSTGPKSLEGKRTSRRNALRHGLTAERRGLKPTHDRRQDVRRFEIEIVAGPAQVGWHCRNEIATVLLAIGLAGGHARTDPRHRRANCLDCDAQSMVGQGHERHDALRPKRRANISLPASIL
jgi:hypothetical protein